MFESRDSRVVRIPPAPRATLPPANTTRWVASRKAEVVAAVEQGVITLAEAMVRYRLSAEEFATWQQAYSRDGVAGLRLASVQRRATAEALPSARLSASS